MIYKPWLNIKKSYFIEPDVLTSSRVYAGASLKLDFTAKRTLTGAERQNRPEISRRASVRGQRQGGEEPDLTTEQ